MYATVTMGIFLGGFPLPLVSILAPLRTHPTPGVFRYPFTPWGHLGAMPGSADLQGRLDGTLGIPTLDGLIGASSP